jgi:hypothetical protein
MATSSKVRFVLEDLRAKALASIDLRIAQAQVEADSYVDDEALTLRVNDWRERQVAKVQALAAQLAEDEAAVDNHRLSKFSLDPIPSVDRWDRRNAQDRLDSLLAKRSQIEAKASAIKPDEDGTVSLTKTQLSDFFGL